MLVISPHLGDGVLALGSVLAASPGSTVATVCTGTPPPDPSGQRPVCPSVEALDRAVSAGLDEDAEALGVLSCKHLHLDFYDERYGLPRTPRLLSTVLADAVKSLPFCLPVAPFGLGPPDHQMVSDCVLDAADQLTLSRLWVYEDQTCPATEEGPDAVSRRAAIERRGWHLGQLKPAERLGDAEVVAKAKYRSRQFLQSHGVDVVGAKVWLLRR